MAIKRYSVVPRVGSGTTADAYRPDLTGTGNTTNFVVVVGFGSRFIVKQTLPDATAMLSTATAFTLGDLLADLTDVNPVALTVGEKTAITNWITTNFPAKVTAWTAANVLDRKQLVTFVVQQLASSGLTLADVVSKFDVS